MSVMRRTFVYCRAGCRRRRVHMRPARWAWARACQRGSDRSGPAARPTSSMRGSPLRMRRTQARERHVAAARGYPVRLGVQRQGAEDEGSAARVLRLAGRSHSRSAGTGRSAANCHALAGRPGANVAGPRGDHQVAHACTPLHQHGGDGDQRPPKQEHSSSPADTMPKSTSLSAADAPWISSSVTSVSYTHLTLPTKRIV